MFVSLCVRRKYISFLLFLFASCIGIEYVPEAIEDAKVNSQINGIDNTLFYAGDMKDILNQDFIETHGRPDVIITDPSSFIIEVAFVLRVSPNTRPRLAAGSSCARANTVQNAAANSAP